jgi:hypothetical protein
MSSNLVITSCTFAGNISAERSPLCPHCGSPLKEMPFPASLTDARKFASVTVKRLSELSGIPAQTVTALEKGTRPATAGLVDRYHQALQIIASELLGAGGVDVAGSGDGDGRE